MIRRLRCMGGREKGVGREDPFALVFQGSRRDVGQDNHQWTLPDLGTPRGANLSLGESAATQDKARISNGLVRLNAHRHQTRLSGNGKGRPTSSESRTDQRRIMVPELKRAYNTDSTMLHVLFHKPAAQAAALPVFPVDRNIRPPPMKPPGRRPPGPPVRGPPRADPGPPAPTPGGRGRGGERFLRVSGVPLPRGRTPPPLPLH